MRKMPSNAAAYLDVARRRWRLFLLPLLIVPALVFFVSRRLPRSYKSTTSVLIQTQVVPAGLAKDAMQSDVKDRFELISTEILSHDRLLRIVNEFGLYKLPGVASREEAVAKLKKELTIEMEGERVEKQGSAVFKISYTAPDALLAQSVVREAANLSINDNLQARDEEVKGNALFIQGQLEKAKAELADKSDRLSVFRAQHAAALPQGTASSSMLAGQLQAQELANGELLERANTQRVLLGGQEDGGKTDGASAAAPSVVDPLVAQKREELRNARLRYTDRHPEVVRLQSELDALQVARAPHGDKSAGAVPLSAAQVQSANQLAAVKAEIRSRAARQATLDQKIHALQGRSGATPLITAQLQQMEGDYDASLKNYDALVEKQHTSMMAAALEESRGRELVEVLDPATLPHSPASPNLKLINLAGVAAGLFLGLMLALGAELFDQSFHDQDDVAAYLDVPMIAVIPYVR